MAGLPANSSGASCTNIAGATSSSYTLQASDVGATIRSVVKATNAGGSATAQWAATTVVAGPPPPPSPPSNTATPTVSGTAQQGSSLTTTNGTWSNNPTSYSYTWQDCNSSGASCTNIAGATSSSYTLQASDVGATIRSVVKATNAGGSATAQSAATTVVAGPPPPPSAPSNTATPTVSGTAQQGSSLTTTNGTWSNNPTSYSYTWQDCNSSGASCTNIAGATSSSYTLQASDVGATIRSVVKATRFGGSATAQSTATAAITSSGGGGGGGTCNLNATPSNFAWELSAARAGPRRSVWRAATTELGPAPTGHHRDGRFGCLADDASRLRLRRQGLHDVRYRRDGRHDHERRQQHHDHAVHIPRRTGDHGPLQREHSARPRQFQRAERGVWLQRSAWTRAPGLQQRQHPVRG